MSSYLFFLGRTPKLSWLELTTFFPLAQVLTPNIVLIPLDTLTIPPAELINLLGGTVKIAQIISEIPQFNASLLANIASQIPAEGKIVFGLSFYETDYQPPRALLQEIKHSLEAQGKVVRFVEAGEDGTLSSVAIVKQGVTELVLVKKQKGWLVGRTVAVQDFARWALRDRGRPFADPKRGMLPPKVARMLVNIARSQITQDQPPESRLLLDPFCGMGTILAEALLSGWRVIGSDQSGEAERKTQANLNWLISKHQDTKVKDYKLFVSEAAHISCQLAGVKVDAIVTEPFMGSIEIRDKSEKIKNMVRGLEKLYIGCLKDWNNILKPEGKIVIALPEYAICGRTYFVKKVIDRCENLGYTTLAGPLEYSRPQAIVRREFYIFQKR